MTRRRSTYVKGHEHEVPIAYCENCLEHEIERVKEAT
jgi:hypothetical protein